MNYYGLAISRGARLAAAAHGGQTLVSESTATLLAGRLPRNAGLRDLDLHRFKDLLIPERVFQLTHPDLPPNFTRIHSLDARKHNLPVQLTRFIGREREMSNLKDHLDTNRLLTLSGTGGCGKTRLALQVAGDVVDRYPDGVWLVEMAAVTDPALIPRVVSSVLAIRQQSGKTIIATIVDAIGRKKHHLLLDRCEHIAAAAADLVAAVLAACPEVAVLATSREPLGVAGEVIWRVPVLSTPDALVSGTAASAQEFEAVQLFVDRARSVDPAFALTDETHRPLPRSATVLTASRLPWNWRPRAFKPSRLRRSALTWTIDFACSVEEWTVLAHHRTLRAAIDWSHDLLTEPERDLLRRLGFTPAVSRSQRPNRCVP